MTDVWTRESLDDYALETSVGLLDALLDAAAAVQPGQNAARYAAELACLGHSASHAARDLAMLAPAPLPLRALA
jgi:hypothetical protein